MRIALLAPSQAGKTSYLYALCGSLMERYNDDDHYNLDFIIKDHNQKGVIRRGYEEMLRKQADLEPTKEITTYQCEIIVHRPDNTTGKIPIEIVDFPGGNISGSRTGSLEDIAIVEKTIDELSRCDGFIVLLDGDKLIDVEGKSKALFQSELRSSDIRQILQQALERRRQAKHNEKDYNAYAFGTGITPIVFAVSKGDKIKHWMKSHKGIFSKFFTALFSSKSKAVQEHEIAISKIIEDQFNKVLKSNEIASIKPVISVYNEHAGVFSCQFIEEPFQFVLFMGLCNAINELRTRSAYWSNEFHDKNKSYQWASEGYKSLDADLYAKKQKGFFGNLGDWWNSKPSQQDLENKLADAKKKLQHTASEHDRTLATKEHVEQYHADLVYAWENILSDEFIYRLNQYQGEKGSFYQKGMNIHELQQRLWWQQSVNRGKLKHEQQSSMHSNIVNSKVSPKVLEEI